MFEGRRIKTLLFIAIQIASVGLSTIGWVVLGNNGDIEVFSNAQTVLSYGQVILLIQSLGLITVLPNLTRRADSENLDTAIAVLILMASVGFCLSVPGAVAATVITPRIGIYSTSIALASLGVIATMAQQIGRSLNSLRIYVIGTVSLLTYPLAWMFFPREGDHAGLRYLWVTILYLLASVVVLVSCIFRSVLSFNQMVHIFRELRCSPRSLKPTLSVSLPIVFHLAAFGFLSQGIRFTASISRLSLSEIASAGYTMMLLGLGTTIITGMNSVLGVNIQTADSEFVWPLFRRRGILYATIGAVTALMTTVATSLEITPKILPGFVPLGYNSVLIGLVCVSAAGYFLNSSMLLRNNATKLLSFATIIVVSFYLSLSLVLGQSIEILLIVFSFSYLALYLFSALTLLVTAKHCRKDIILANIPSSFAATIIVSIWLLAA